jgi:hypothetical protein
MEDEGDVLEFGDTERRMPRVSRRVRVLAAIGAGLAGVVLAGFALAGHSGGETPTPAGGQPVTGLPVAREGHQFRIIYATGSASRPCPPTKGAITMCLSAGVGTGGSGHNYTR